MPRKTRKVIPNYYRLYSWHEDRKASVKCIRYFVKKALYAKIEALSHTPEAAERCCLYMNEVYARDKIKNVHQIARGYLEYARLRAFAAVGEKEAGSYAPAGFLIDRPAAALWDKLNKAEE